ncbi:hypothetical protein UXJ26_06010 [Burkholderia multivorans]|uniref:Bacteriophage protein n=1 Tax=Burkholderia multivorans (strain ATCC 17616 / 249) TaxID=395019 RepID=A0A0H3KMR1_BURM1|nr:hypothetical protein [Burkholderia multivorans]YP_355378.1 gp43 [Burkholderia phage Bcep176]ABA60044.1 gp43 [Burkholderia phage Bcep176]ABX17519.1 hypothetical protein Bmul_3836 [Burkholderia multivorans ATCC 17616]PRF62425.1 hypothetical protein C6Q28_10625 [Burkholderia multivorans]BAG46531.1 bacteriophage protein [Burkholderia multivorans ATCC 17616]
MCITGPRIARRVFQGRKFRPAFLHRRHRWVLGVTGGRRRTLNRSAAQRPSCYPTLPYASRAPTPDADATN